MISISRLTVIIVGVIALNVAIANADIPSFIQVCVRDQDTISDCVRESIDKLRPKLVHGIPELNVPGIEPLIIEELPVEQGNIVRFKAVGHDVKVYGASNFKIKKLNVDLDTLILKADIFFPILKFDGKYEMDGRLLVVPLHGKGDITANATNCDAQMILHGKLVDRDGKKVLHFNKMEINLSVKDYDILLTNLFNGEQELGNVANRFINDNKSDFWRASKPFMERTTASYLRKLANKVVSSTEFDELIPVAKST